MMRTKTPWRASAILLAVTGIVIAAVGVYFIFLRPPLLAEDIRFMHLSEAEATALLPRPSPWLDHVFEVLGGYALATGLLAATLAATSLRARDAVATLGAALAGAASIGFMAVVNFALDSDFKWVLAAIAALRALSLIAFWVEARSAKGQPSPTASHKGNAL